MIIPSLTTDELKASVVPYTNYRIALASTILGTVSVLFVWLWYLAHASCDPGLLFTVAIGVTLGYIVHWFQHYARVAAHEKRGEPVHHDANRALKRVLSAAVIGVIALASEHVIAEMVAKFFRPVLASLVTLVPAGAIIGWSMNRGRSKDKNFLLFLADGLLIGASIGVVTGTLWAIAFRETQWIALVSWWGLIGLGTHLMTGPERNSVRFGDPIAAVAIVFVGTFLINLLPMTEAPYNKLGVFKTLPEAIRIMAAEIQESPGVPATFWINGERELAAECADKKGKRGAVQETRTQRPSTPPPSAKPVDIRKAVENLANGAPAVSPAALLVTRTRATWGQLARSWIIIFVFAIGVGAAPAVERALRPIDYPNSETYRQDVRLTWWVVLLLAFACVVGRYAGH